MLLKLFCLKKASLRFRLKKCIFKGGNIFLNIEMINEIYIYGSGHCGVLTALDCEEKGIKVLGFIDRDAEKIKTRLGLPVLAPDVVFRENYKPKIIIAIYNQNVVKEIVEILSKAGLKEYNDFNTSPLISIPNINNTNYLKKRIQNYFKENKNKVTPMVVYMADEIGINGWSDRLKGIISLYKICKIYCFQFKINFTVPFDLSDYLLPNVYDWQISTDEISSSACRISNFHQARRFGDGIDNYSLSYENFEFILCNYAMINSQTLVYTNMYYNVDNDFGILFNELFKLSDELQNIINFHREQMNNKYISVSCRFLHLLGDFKERKNHPILPVNMQNAFIQQMSNHLLDIHEQNKEYKILVCSDSEKFINAAIKYDFVYAIKGKRQHIDNPAIEKEGIMFTLIDYFLISQAEKIYCVVDEIEADGIKYKSYSSAFPRTASRINNVKFTVLNLLNKPKISVIVPIYNVESYLRKCLDSLINQTLNNIEIICVNDCSPDNSLAILEEYAKKDSRIKIISFKKNKGVSVARNKGMEISNGEYIGFVDPDDYVDLDFYEKLYKSAKRKNADIAVAVRKINEIGTNKEYVYEINEKIRKHKCYFTATHQIAIYKISMLKKHDIKYPPNIITTQDSVFLNAAVIAAKNICVINDTYYHYVRRENSSYSAVYSKEKAYSVLLSRSIILDNLNRSIKKIDKFHYTFVYQIYFANIFRILLRYCEPEFEKEIIKVAIKYYHKCKYPESLQLPGKIEILLKEKNAKDLLKECNLWKENRFYPEIHIDKVKIKNCKLYIWGTGEDGINVLAQCNNNGWKIEAFLDSNPNIKEFQEHKVLSPQSLLDSANKDYFIVISSRKYGAEISKLCRESGLKKGKDFWSPE